MEQIKEGDKLYIVVRADINPGLQCAQIAHTAFGFSLKYPEETLNWYNNSNYIAILNCNNEEYLRKLIDKSIVKNIKHYVFVESDLDNQITAVAFEATISSKKMCSNLKLALKDLK